MRPESMKLLEDIRELASDALEIAAGRSLEDYLTDKQLRYAVERCFEIAGEALAQLHKFDADRALKW